MSNSDPGLPEEALGLPLHVLAEKLRAGEMDARDLARATLNRIHDIQPLNAFLAVCDTLASEQANEAAQRIKRGEGGALAGIPVAIKDNICVRGVPMTCGSRILEGYISPYNATVVERLEDAGALIVGKTNLDEFGMGSTNELSAFGPCLNPLRRGASPGGSSGGSAVAVACGAAAAALGSDTGGSVRLPAALTGIVGLKPTWGRVSRYGMTAYASSLDHVGILTRCVTDAAHVLEVIAGHDPRDATSLNRDPPDLLSRIDEGINGLRIGRPPPEYFVGVSSDVMPCYLKALARLEDLGARVVTIELPAASLAVSAYYVLAAAEASSNLARFDGVRYGRRASGGSVDDLCARSRTEGFGPEVTRRILLGTFALSAGYRDAWYGRALSVRDQVRERFSEVFAKCRVVATPAAPVVSFKLGEHADPLTMYRLDTFTVPANLAGIPALVLPVGWAAPGAPFGLQLMGPSLSEGMLVRVARAIERETTFVAEQARSACQAGGSGREEVGDSSSERL